MSSAQFQLALFGAVPAIVAMMYFDRLDAKRPEPRSTLRRVALAGGLSAIPVVLIGSLLKLIGPAGMDGGADGGSATYAGALYMAFVIAALPEEAAKMCSMLWFAWRRPEFDERMDGIVYGARAGLGFALLENVLYLLVMPANFSEYIAVFIGRAVLAVPGHATWGGIIGYFGARRRFDGKGIGLLGGYLLAVALHGTYDAVLFAAPVAIGKGHAWVGLGIAGVPVIAYVVPAIIILFGAITLRELARRAIAADDADASVPATPYLPPGGPAAAHPYPGRDHAPPWAHPGYSGHPPAGPGPYAQRHPQLGGFPPDPGPGFPAPEWTEPGLPPDLRGSPIPPPGPARTGRTVLATTEVPPRGRTLVSTPGPASRGRTLVAPRPDPTDDGPR